MARRVEQLVERQSALDAELQQLMPKQYVDSTNDTLGECWQRAVESSDRAHEYLLDLWCILECKAERADARAKAVQAVSEPSPVLDELEVDGPVRA